MALMGFCWGKWFGWCEERNEEVEPETAERRNVERRFNPPATPPCGLDFQGSVAEKIFGEANEEKEWKTLELG